MQRGRKKPIRERKLPETVTNPEIPEVIEEQPLPGIDVFTEDELFGDTTVKQEPVYRNTLIIPEQNTTPSPEPVITDTTPGYNNLDIMAMSVIQLRHYVETQHPEWNELLDVYNRAELQNKILQRLGLIA